MSKKQLLNEYEAAVIVGISPRLLRWFTQHGPKQGKSRKLRQAQTIKDVSFYDQKELLKFNEWLRQPWPHKKGKRPPVPSGIREEVQVEANGECAICNSHKDTCQAAHLDPVSNSKNNHPENLLWLCSNHHIAYDDGLFGPDFENKDFVTSFKTVLHRHKRMLWQMQDEVSRKLFVLLEDCNRLATQFEHAKTAIQVKAIEKIASETLGLIPKLGPVSKKDPAYKAYSSISSGLSNLRHPKEGDGVSATLQKARSIKEQYVAALGFVPCPLCGATGSYDGLDCPVCSGDKEIDRKIANKIDTDLYTKVKCSLCKGGGRFKSEDCPECEGEGKLQRRYAEQIDVSKYEVVSCPLCKSHGNFRGETCPECNGEGKMENWQADQVDVSKYKNVECPLCKGSGEFRSNDCPECAGEGKMENWQADQVDVSKYKNVECPLCEGSGEFRSNDCPECAGEGKMESWQADQVDVTKYEKVECPLCKGSGDLHSNDCPECGGNGKLESWQADQIDLAKYQIVGCPLCEGSGKSDHGDCPACDGEGKVESWYAERIELDGE
jgi:DnaJ-class molecular chaperone